MNYIDYQYDYNIACRICYASHRIFRLVNGVERMRKSVVMGRVQLDIWLKYFIIIIFFFWRGGWVEQGYLYK